MKHIACATLTVLVAISTALLPNDAAAVDASGRIVVSAYGGIWEKSIKENFVSCYKNQTGKDVAIQVGNPAAWLNQIRANPDHPPIDVVTLPQADTIRAIREGLLETLSSDRLPNLKDIPSRHYEVWDNKAVDVHVGALGVMYNKDAIHEPPKDWRTLLDNIAAGKYGKRVSLPSGSYTWGPDFIWFVAQVYGGDINTAFAKLKAMMPYVTKFWTEPTEALNLFATKQVDILVYWDGRSYDFIDKGNSWAAYYNPGPHSLGVTVTFAKVKNSSPMAWDYVNCALSAKAQLGHAEMLGYGVTNSKVVYPESIRHRITPDSEMIFLPYSKYIDSFPSWIERWNREMR